MEIKKRDIAEIVNSNNDLIGFNDIPTHGADLETQANNTTDQNAKVGAQPFRYDMLGRFGFTLLPFFEGKENQEQNEMLNDLAELMYEKHIEILEYYYRHPNKLKSDFRIHSGHNIETQSEDEKKSNFEWAKKIINVIQSHFEKAFKEPKNLDEAKVVEDKVIDKKSETEIAKKCEDREVREKKIEKIAGLINKKLDKKDIDNLINLLERK